VSAESYRLIFEKNPLPMWVFDLQTLRFLDVNEAAIRTYGYSRSEFLDMTIEDVRPGDEVPRLREVLKNLKATDRMVGIWRHRTKDGAIIEVEVLSSEVSVMGRRARLVLVNDVTERMRAERHRATETAVTRVLVDARSSADAAPKVLAAICDTEDWAVGEVWLYDPEATVLRRDGTWYTPQLYGVSASEYGTTSMTCRPGEGLVGRTWSSNAPIWIRDVHDEKDFERGEAAMRLGLRGALAVPIRKMSGVAGVMLFFSQSEREPDEQLVDLLIDIGSRIGKILDLNRAEAKKRLAEEAFQKAFYASPIPMAISGLKDGRFSEVNDQFLRMFEYERDQVLGHRSTELKMWEDPIQRSGLASRLREQGSIRDAEIAIRTKSGRIRRVLLSVEPLEMRDQPAIITVDVTDVNMAQEAKARLGAIVEGSDDAILGKTLEGKITSWNEAAERIYGYTAQEAIGQPIAMIVPDDRRAELDGIMARLRKGETLSAFETVRVRKDGRKIVVSVTISPVRDLADRVIGASSIARDATERKRSDQLLRRSEARFRQLFEAAADAILLIDGRGTILEVNPSGGALLGARNPAALRGINLAELLPSRELEKARNYLRDLLSERPVKEPFETYVEVGKGERRFLQVRSRVIREEGADPYLQVIARDVTVEKEFQRRLLETERQTSMAQLAAFVAHEVNTPLTNIALVTANLTRSTDDPNTLEKLAKIDAQRRRTASIVGELQSLTRSQEFKRIPTDLRGIVDAAIDQVGALRAHGVAFVKEYPAGPVVASVDPLRLQQAMVNLLRNAFQATTTGNVTVRLEATPEFLGIEVSDTGTGMDEEVRTRLFQPFYTTKERGEGMGLGLLIARQIAEAHGGSVEVQTEPRKGSTLTIRLPSSKPEPST
jgi:PAS domain S-box-containing protein